MSIGRRKNEPQSEFWVATHELPRSPGHPFYEQLNRILDAAGFERFCEEACRKFCAEKMGRPSIPPGLYFRMLMVGYFEKIDSEKGHRLALQRFALAASLSGTQAAGRRGGRQFAEPRPAANRSGDAPGGLRLDAQTAGRV